MPFGADGKEGIPMILLELFLSFFQIGLFSIGGGYTISCHLWHHCALNGRLGVFFLSVLLSLVPNNNKKFP